MRSMLVAAMLISALTYSGRADDKFDQPSKDQPKPLIAPFDARQAKAAQEAWAKSLGKSSPVEKNSIGMELVLIPPGDFRMGSPMDDKDRDPNEGPVDVTLTKPYFLGKTEVTQGQWRAVMGTTPWKESKSMLEGDAYPVTFVSWEDAQAFCKKLSETEMRVYRLPTEAEWEYACRAGTTTRFSFGDDAVLRREFGANIVVLDEYAWWGKTLGDGVDATKYEHAVGLKKPNSFGLFDMHGNAGEWCGDWYKANYPKSPLIDPVGPPAGSYRVYRGGSWFADNAKWCRSASRGWGSPGARQFISLGFRVAAGDVK
jgi:formylglycine-generating enzyme required for sulfatase activity